MAKVRIALKELMEREKKAGRPYTQEDIAERIQVAQGTLSRWVGNRVDRIDLTVLEKLCDYFDCEISDILKLEREEKKS
jgi:putative transcriptional regulator